MTAKKKTQARSVDNTQPDASARATPLQRGDDLGAANASRRVGLRLREKRRARGLTLDHLAMASGVSRGALSQIEQLNGNPSLGVLWKTAVGLGIPVAELLGGPDHDVAVLRRTDSQVLRSEDSNMESRPLAPAGACPWIEIYELRLPAHASHSSEAHVRGTREFIAVEDGELKLHLGDEVYTLGPGDAVSFRADVVHTYENPGGSQGRYHNTIVHPR